MLTTPLCQLACDTGGSVLLYGKLYGPSWTTLSTSVAKGATTMTLTEPVAWLQGDSIVLSSSDYDQNQCVIGAL